MLPKLRVGAVVYSRPSLDPPIITNTYFMDLQAGFKDWQDNQVAFGLGSCPGPEDGGMALLEALVASLEVWLCSTVLYQRVLNFVSDVRPHNQRNRNACHTPSQSPQSSSTKASCLPHPSGDIFPGERAEPATPQSQSEIRRSHSGDNTSRAIQSNLFPIILSGAPP